MSTMGHKLGSERHWAVSEIEEIKDLGYQSNTKSVMTLDQGLKAHKNDWAGLDLDWAVASGETEVADKEYEGEKDDETQRSDKTGTTVGGIWTLTRSVRL